MATERKRQAKAKNAVLTQKSKLEKLGYQNADITVKGLRSALKQGMKYAELEDWEKALPHLLKAWDAMPDDVPLLTLIAHGLSRLGVREFAIEVLERALSQGEPTVDICTIMQNLAIEMGMYEVAVKLGVQLVNMEPDAPRHYVNLATAHSGLRAFDESIDMLQGILPLFPENADLWNVLATQVRERDGAFAADVFFDEALRLSPADYKIASNYAQSFSMRQDYDAALEMNLRAVKANPESPEPRMGVAQISFLRGDMKAGWENYECRLSPRRKITQTQIYTHGLDEWVGQSLGGKSLLVAAEQGIGDEVLFGNFLPFLYERVKKLAIGCDKRLVSIYQRRFPDAVVSPYIDHFQNGYRYRTFPYIQGPMNEGDLHLDYAVPVAEGPRYDWTRLESIKYHPDGFVNADPELAEKFQVRMAELGNKPKVGLSWRSGLVSADRAGMYAEAEQLARLFAYKDQVEFINLQYGDCAEELQSFKEQFGVTVHNFADVDLRMDIEANLAIMENCDVMIGGFSAPGMFAMSLGRPCMLMGKAPPWYVFGAKEKVPFVKDATYTSALNGKNWDGIMADVETWMVSRLGLTG